MIISRFLPTGRGKAQCPPDPSYPNGTDVNLQTTAGQTCTIELPYPAPECGMHIVHCSECGLEVAITAAGRADDPRRVTLPCLDHSN